MTQSYIKALTSKNSDAYKALIAEDFVGVGGENRTADNREAWFRNIADTFGNPDYHVIILNVFQGSQDDNGRLRQRVMLVQRATNIATRSNGAPADDCCVYYLIETITFDGAKIKQIERSPLFVKALSKTGERTDLGPPVTR